MSEISRFPNTLIGLKWADRLLSNIYARHIEYKITVETETGYFLGIFPPRSLRTD